MERSSARAVNDKGSRLGPLGVRDCPERAKGADDVDYDWVVGPVQQRQRGSGDTDDADNVDGKHREPGPGSDPDGADGAVLDAGWLIRTSMRPSRSSIDVTAGLHGSVVGDIDLNESAAELEGVRPR
ncbi:MAG: hypothetical protein WAL63_17475 [Solirubrobacteraceae bacterium]